MKTRFTLCFLALAIASSVPLAPAMGGGGVRPSGGDYEARPAKISGVYQLGAFAVINEGGKRRIVSSELYQGIFYPDLGKCDKLNLPLLGESIPISVRGRFSVRERTPLARGAVLVVWKGAWTKPKRVAGTIKIEYRKCSSKFDWVGKRVPLSP